VEGINTLLHLKIYYLFDKLNHERSHIFIASACDLLVKVLDTPLCLKDMSFEKISSFYRVPCDQQVEELSNPQCLKIQYFKETSFI